jgi:L-2,4-diaminobutyric acid acetyltransferase
VTAGNELMIRAPAAADGAAIAELVRATGVLEPATDYAYVMVADLFGDTCAIAKLADVPAGCVVAFRPPRAPNALFVWQIGVHPRAQRRGLAHAMLDAVLARPSSAGIRELHTTVAPSNAPSEEMFRSYAARRSASIECARGYPAEFFPDPHEPERLLRITGLRQLVRPEQTS